MCDETDKVDALVDILFNHYLSGKYEGPSLTKVVRGRRHYWRQIEKGRWPRGVKNVLDRETHMACMLCVPLPHVKRGETIEWGSVDITGVYDSLRDRLYDELPGSPTPSVSTEDAPSPHPGSLTPVGV